MKKGLIAVVIVQSAVENKCCVVVVMVNFVTILLFFSHEVFKIHHQILQRGLAPLRL